MQTEFALQQSVTLYKKIAMIRVAIFTAMNISYRMTSFMSKSYIQQKCELGYVKLPSTMG